MNKPLITICIPTYNRACFLKLCLESIYIQLTNESLEKKIRIIILDNQSQDNTEEIVKNFTDLSDNFQYVKDNENRNMIQGIIKVASLANSEYIWVFSDDDLQNNKLELVINFIEKYKPELVVCNLVGFNNKNTTRHHNLLKVSGDILLNNRKDFFNLLGKKFNTTIDYYTTLCSNWIIKKSVFDNNYYILNNYNNKLDMFPLPSLFFYTNIQFKTGIIAEEIILNRGGNASWEKKNAFRNYFHVNNIWKDYYNKIIKNNREYLPAYFILKIHFKNLLRIKFLLRLIIIKLLIIINLYNFIKQNNIIKK